MSEPTTGSAVNLPYFQSHKIVQGMKIHDTYQVSPQEPESDWMLVPDNNTIAPVRVSAEWFTKHNPQKGGYYVLYSDGYESYSPAVAFETGYTSLGTLGATLDEEPMLKYFKWEHLPENLQKVSALFGTLAIQIVLTVPRSAERTVALRKLMEGKDCAVRASLP